METDKKLSYIASIGIVFVLLLLTILFQVIGLADSSRLVTDKILNAAYIVESLFGSVYALKGFKKDVSDFFKAYMIIHALKALCSLISGIFFDASVFASATEMWKAVGFGSDIVFAIVSVCAFVLAFGKDLGKKKSMLLAEISFILICTVTLITIIIAKDFTMYYDVYISEILTSLIALLFVRDKYLDKAARGTK